MPAQAHANEAAVVHSDEPSKKRAAERQITKDDAPDEGSDDEEETAPGTSFPKADAATLSSRRILKARHPTAPLPSASHGGDDETDQKKQSNRNPFANIQMSATVSVFGSGFGGGFGAATSGTRFDFASTSTTASSSGFASTPPGSSTASVFGSSSTAFSGGLASTTSSESAFGATSSKPEPPNVVLPEVVELRNGEEEEECVLEFRAKSHILVDVEETKASPEPERPSAPSVPPSSSTAPVASPPITLEAAGEEATDESKSAAADESHTEDKKETKKDDTTTGEKEEKVLNDKEESKEAAQTTNGDTKKRQQEWRELGIGPLRILKKDKCHTRVVQRRETQPGGAGTKLIVNVPLPKECTVALQGEKYVRLTTMEPSGKAAIFLLKVKTATEAQELRDVLEREIDKAASFVGK